jgi:hypothetical protein
MFMDKIEYFSLTIYNLSTITVGIMQWVVLGLFLIGIMVLLPISLIRKARRVSGISLFLISQIFFFYIWVSCVSISFTVTHWGVALVGVITVIGSIPVAIVGSLFEGSPVRVIEYLILFAIAYGFQIGGGMISSSTKHHK